MVETDGAAHAASDTQEPKRHGGWVRDVAITLLIAIGAAWVLRTFVIGTYEVPTASMLDTIQEGDLILGERVSLAWDDPNQGDIVTFESPTKENVTLVKRVIAVGGQTVDLRDGVVYVDGVALDEDSYTGGKPSYSLSDVSGSAGISYPYEVPEGYIWVMGDNRTNSLDSRYFGAVPVSSVTSKVVCIYWPLSDIKAL